MGITHDQVDGIPFFRMDMTHGHQTDDHDQCQQKAQKTFQIVFHGFPSFRFFDTVLRSPYPGFLNGTRILPFRDSVFVDHTPLMVCLWNCVPVGAYCTAVYISSLTLPSNPGAVNAFSVQSDDFSFPFPENTIIFAQFSTITKGRPFGRPFAWVGWIYLAAYRKVTTWARVQV